MKSKKYKRRIRKTLKHRGGAHAFHKAFNRQKERESALRISEENEELPISESIVNLLQIAEAKHIFDEEYATVRRYEITGNDVNLAEALPRLRLARRIYEHIRVFQELDRIIKEQSQQRDLEEGLLIEKKQLAKEKQELEKRLHIEHTRLQSRNKLYSIKEHRDSKLLKDSFKLRIAQIDEAIRSQRGPIVVYPDNRAQLYPNFVELGRGGTKVASKRRVSNGWAYLRPMRRDIKSNWEDDYDFSLLLYRVYPAFFPSVETTLITPRTYQYRKELCDKVESGREGNLTGDVLHTIIESFVELIDDYGLFTFDLKPPNMGIRTIDGTLVFIDFGPDSSFLLRPDCDTTDYKSAIILILLIYCYNFCLGDPMLTREHLRALAREFIHDIAYQRLFSPDYRIEGDPCLDLSFNKRLAPSFKTYLTPKQFLDVYSIPRGGAHSNLDEIFAYFSS
jgi:hypothetical protein